MEKENAENKAAIFNETSDGTTYVYSEEDIETFKAAAEKLMNKEVAAFDLKPGENKLRKLQAEAAEYAFQEMLESGFLTEEEAAEARESKSLMYSGTVSDLSDEDHYVHSNVNLTAADLFNEDLSLIDPYIFYGYTSVDNPSLEIMRSDEDFIRTFNDFVFALKTLDERYKDSSALRSFKSWLDIDSDLGFIDGNDPESETMPKYAEGAIYVLWNEWLSSEKENSMNPYLKYFRVGERFERISNTLSWVEKARRKENDVVNYEPLSSEFNYWEANESSYFTVYYPTKITKLSDFMYVVDIETEKPIDAYGAANLATNIRSYIEKQTQLFTCDNFQVVIRVKDSIYHDMNAGILLTDIANDMFYYNDERNLPEGVSPATGNGYRYDFMNWEPSEEVRPWVDEYFSIAAEAYEKDERFSIFETIEYVADKFDADYDDVECVIMSCYWIYNGPIYIF